MAETVNVWQDATAELPSWQSSLIDGLAIFEDTPPALEWPAGLHIGFLTFGLSASSLSPAVRKIPKIAAGRTPTWPPDQDADAV